jgi:hypothetical protein
MLRDCAEDDIFIRGVHSLPSDLLHQCRIQVVAISPSVESADIQLLVQFVNITLAYRKLTASAISRYLRQLFVQIAMFFNQRQGLAISGLSCHQSICDR